MATEPRLETLLDDPFCLAQAPSRRSSLQLPPLQGLSLRPLPLEPSTAANGQSHSGPSKLSRAHGGPSSKVQSGLNESQRQKDGKRKIGEIAKRKPSGGEQGLLQPGIEILSEDDTLFDVDEASPETDSPSRKRQKLDTSHASATSFVQLPRPTEKEKKPAKVPTIAALNELKTQLSNAGHFPPIAFLASDDEDNDQNESAPLDTSLNLEGQTRPSRKPFSRQKKACKPRRKWTEQETEYLLHGVALHGVGNWKTILEDSKFKFDARSSVDLKDRFRTCCPNEYGISVKSNPANPSNVNGGSGISHTQLLNFSKSSPLGLIEGQPSSSSSSAPELSQSSSPGLSISTSISARSHRVKPEDLARLGIDGPFPKSKRRERRAFTEEEDQHLLKGYMAYGPTWSRIREDPSLNLKIRRAIDLRDRFRNRFPEKYAEAGFKMRPKDWPGPPPRSDKNEEQAGNQGSPSSSPPPGESEDTLKVAGGQPEIQAESLVVQDDDTIIPSINSLVDWDDNTLPPFLTNANGADSDMQNLLLDHIQPLLTYDPPRSYESHNTSKNKSKRHNLATEKTAANDNTKKTTIDDLSKKQTTPFYLPPPTEFLPLDFDISPSSTANTSSSSTAATTSFSSTILSTLTPSLPTSNAAINFPLTFNIPLKPGETTSKRAPSASNPSLDTSVVNPRAVSRTTAGGDGSGSVAVAPAALIWEDMATHPMFDIDGGGSALVGRDGVQ